MRPETALSVCVTTRLATKRGEAGRQQCRKRWGRWGPAFRSGAGPRPAFRCPAERACGTHKSITRLFRAFSSCSSSSSCSSASSVQSGRLSKAWRHVGVVNETQSPRLCSYPGHCNTLAWHSVAAYDAGQPAPLWDSRAARPRSARTPSCLAPPGAVNPQPPLHVRGTTPRHSPQCMLMAGGVVRQGTPARD